MRYLKKLSAVLLVIILVSILVAPICYANDAGPPIIFNPNVNVTFTVDSDTAAPNKELTFTVHFINKSTSSLYISDISIYKNNSVIDEDNFFYFGDLDTVVNPNETVTFEKTIIPSVDNFHFENGKMSLYLNPVVSYQQYAPYSSSKQPVIGLNFEAYSNKPLKLTWHPPFRAESPIDVKYAYNKLEAEGNKLYNFTVRMKNTTDQELYDLQIVSDTIVEGAISTTEDLSYLAPGEEKSVSYTYDNSKSEKPYLSTKPFVIYVISRYKDSEDYIASIAKDIGEMRFNIPSLSLRAKIICDADKAFFGENIPFILELFNPTKHTFNDIKFPYLTGEDIEEIKPNETIKINLEKQNYLDYYTNNLSEGLNTIYTIEPTIGYKGNKLSFSEWCINHQSIKIPKINITMPPQTNDLDIIVNSNNRITTNKLYIEITNNSDEDIYIDIISFPKTHSHNVPSSGLISKGTKKTITLTPSIGVLINDYKNVYTDLCIIGLGEKTQSLYWLRDYFKVDFSPQPTPTPKPTTSPSPTPKPIPAPTLTPKPTSTSQPVKLVATIKNIDQKTVELLLLNNSSDDIYKINVVNKNGETIHMVEKIEANQYQNINLAFDNNSSIVFDVTYKNSDGNEFITTTNKIVSLKLDKTRYIEPFAGLVLVVTLLLLFVFIIIIGYQIKYSRKSNN